jgi:hypothetical protein
MEAELPHLHRHQQWKREEHGAAEGTREADSEVAVDLLVSLSAHGSSELEAGDRQLGLRLATGD